MAIAIERHNDHDGMRIIVRGDVDMTTGPRLEEALQEAEQSGPGAITLDLCHVEFFDSTGLQILLDTDLRAAQDGRALVLLVGDGEAARVLELAQVADQLTVAVLE